MSLRLRALVSGEASPAGSVAVPCRRSNARGLLFYRLPENAVTVKKLDYSTIVYSRRGEAGKRRGPQPKPAAQRAPKGRAAASRVW